MMPINTKHNKNITSRDTCALAAAHLYSNSEPTGSRILRDQLGKSVSVVRMRTPCHTSHSPSPMVPGGGGLGVRVLGRFEFQNVWLLGFEFGALGFWFEM